MWQTDWAEPRQGFEIGPPQASTLLPGEVRSTYLLLWVEHCIECAIPDCYKLCPLYVARKDGKCARFRNGISPNRQYPGLFPFGAEVEFRRWGQLEANFGFGALKTEQARLIDRVDRGFLTLIRPVETLLGRLSSNRKLNRGYALLRERILQWFTRGHKESFDEFVVEVWNLQSQPVRLVIECWQAGPRFRTSILLKPGRTIQRISLPTMNIDLYGKVGDIRIYPENDAEAHVVFSWLDFVQYESSAAKKSPGSAGRPETQGVLSAEKVKCVIWDLDQTAWEGILGEQDADMISLHPEVLRTMLALDERGILQSVASKNDHDIAWRALDRLGVAHLFLYPQINWEPKSANIQRIATSLNIGIDSCAFIDDSPFERAEVAHELPGIRVFSDSDARDLLGLPEFDVPITLESRQRRSFYVAESQRKHHAVEYGTRYEAFLKTCEMEATLWKLAEPDHVDRCLELLHRSNQLNLSPHRYTRKEFENLLQQPDVLCICTACKDRFGDYGIIGFASVVMSPEAAILKDFVLSCRVAQKKVENAWFKFVTSLADSMGYRKICAPYVKTSRNTVLLKAFLEVGFVETRKDDTGSILELKCPSTPPASEIVSIVGGSFELPATSPINAVSLPHHVGETREAAS